MAKDGKIQSNYLSKGNGKFQVINYDFRTTITQTEMRKMTHINLLKIKLTKRKETIFFQYHST